MTSEITNDTEFIEWVREQDPGRIDCGETALEMLLRMPLHLCPVLVHGRPKYGGDPALADSDGRYFHAWVEVDPYVVDFSHRKKLVIPRTMYYILGQLRSLDVVKYDYFDALQMAVEHGTYGPWIEEWL